MKKIFAVIVAVLLGLPAEALAQEVIDSPIRASCLPRAGSIG
jgi:hypothetical protein